MNLPSMIYTSSKKKNNQTIFGGLNHSESASDGEIYDMKNLASDNYPYLAPRAKRRKIYDGTVTDLTSVGNTLYFLTGSISGAGGELLRSKGVNTEKMASTEAVGVTFSDSGEILCVMGQRLILRLDGVAGVFDTETCEYRSIAVSMPSTATVEDGTLNGEATQCNRLFFTSYYGPAFRQFREGDGVHITIENADDAILETDAVIRELDDEEGTFTFDENIFEGISGSHSVTVERKVPDFSYICACNNRLFACNGTTVWASALGDPFNWYVYDGISTDSWSVETEDSGEFTACCEFLGYPHFFKADAIYKLYGGTASEYQLSKTNAFGVKEGAAGSLGAVGSTLFYLSPAGVCAYSGGYPTVILPPEQMGGNPCYSGAAATVGYKYFLWVRMTDGYVGIEDNQLREIYVYDTAKGIWHIEEADVLPACSSGYPGSGQINLLGYSHNGIWLMGTPAFTASADDPDANAIGTPEGNFISFAEFGYAFHDTMNAKQLYKLIVRLLVDSGARIKIYASYDDGPYRIVYETKSRSRQTLSVPIRPKRCDRYRLKIEGIGNYKIYAITKEYSVSAK